MAGCWFANAEDIYREVERSIGSEIVVCITRGSNILLITLISRSRMCDTTTITRPQRASAPERSGGRVEKWIEAGEEGMGNERA
jgi:hypothetical protein